MEADGLFVHSSLREGGRHWAWLARTQPEGTCRAWTPGRLFHLPQEQEAALVPGPIPQEVPPAPGWVVGAFVGYENDLSLQQALSDLDPLFGVEEERFHRLLLPVLLEGGQIYKAWAWVFHVERLPRLEREAAEILDGDWSPYL